MEASNWIRTAALATVMAVAASGSAVAGCAEGDWKDCAGQPWVDGDVMETPLGSKWWPHPIWGAGDEAGSTNWYTKPEVVQRALALAKTGNTLKIGHEYVAEMPLFGARKFSMRIPGGPTGGPFGKNALVYHDEVITTQIGQIQTQFDGPGHIGVNTSKGMFFYNGVNPFDPEDGYERGAGGQVMGMGALGVEHVGELGFVCRLVVLDAVA